MGMRRVLGLLVMSGLVAIPAMAQHAGGGHAGGGFSGHAGGFGGMQAGHSFAAAPSGFAQAPRSFATAPHYSNWTAGARGPVPGRGLEAPRSVSPYRIPYTETRGRRPGPPDHRPPYRRPNRGGYPGLYGYNGAYLAPPYFLNPWLFNDTGYDDSADAGLEQQDGGGPYDPGYDQAQGPYDPGPYGQDPEPQGYAPARPAYNPQPNPPAPPAPAAAATAAINEDRPTVTLVFKDNSRPAQQVHNYALTRTTLYVLDGHSHEIPLDQIDMGATVKTNREAGIDFALPTN